MLSKAPEDPSRSLLLNLENSFYQSWAFSSFHFTKINKKIEIKKTFELDLSWLCSLCFQRSVRNSFSFKSKTFAKWTAFEATEYLNQYFASFKQENLKDFLIKHIYLNLKKNDYVKNSIYRFCSKITQRSQRLGLLQAESVVGMHRSGRVWNIISFTPIN